MTGPLALACGSLGVVLIAYPLVLVGVDPVAGSVAALSIVALFGALGTRRWLLLGGSGAALMVLYLVAMQSATPPRGLATAFVGVGLLVLVELFDRLCAAAASQGLGVLDARHGVETAFGVAAGLAAALVVLLAGGLLRAVGPVTLAIAGACALGATATVVVLSDDDDALEENASS
jgi:hypothetical protein